MLPTYFGCFFQNIEVIGIIYVTIYSIALNTTADLRICRKKCKNHMHRTLREPAPPGNSALYPNIQINDGTLGTSYRAFSI